MYTLRYPFRLQPGRALGTPADTGLCGLKVSLTRDDDLYVLTITGFHDKAGARAFIANLRIGLMWVLVNSGIASHGESAPREPAYSENPVESANLWRQRFGIDCGEELHGLIDGDRPAIFETDKSFRKIMMGTPTVTASTPASSALLSFAQAAQFANPNAVLANTKLTTAMDLYSTYFLETSERAKFLTLVMALEALTESRRRPTFILALLERFQDEIASMKADTSSAEKEALESLDRELAFRKYDSIRSQIRRLVGDTLSVNGDADADEMARIAVRLYDSRSRLVHDGILPDQDLTTAMNDANEIVARVLRAQLLRISNSQ